LRGWKPENTSYKDLARYNDWISEGCQRKERKKTAKESARKRGGKKKMEGSGLYRVKMGRSASLVRKSRGKNPGPKEGWRGDEG